MARNPSLKMTLLHCVKHLSHDDMLTMYKAKVRPVMEYALSPGCQTPSVTLAELSNDYILEVPRSRSITHQRAFTTAAVRLWNAFATAMDIRQMPTQQVKGAAHRWLQHQPS